MIKRQEILLLWQKKKFFFHCMIIRKENPQMYLYADKQKCHIMTTILRLNVLRVEVLSCCKQNG